MKTFTKPLFFLSLLLITPMLATAQISNGYCNNKGARGNVWLQKVSIGNWSNNSSGNSGYLYQPDSKLVLKADTSYGVQLELGGYPRVQDSAYWRIWIDFNRDLDFEDAGEQVFQSKTVYKGVARGTLKLPRLFEAEKYMLRIVVSKTRFSPACGESSVIEMEDYLAAINPAFACNTPLAGNILIDEISDTAATLSVKDLPALKYVWHIESVDGKFSKDTAQVSATPILWSTLTAQTKYKVRLKIECAGGESRWSDDVVFTTLPKDLCLVPNKNNISAVQIDGRAAQLAYNGANGRRVELRYRVQGNENWTLLPGNPSPIYFPVGGGTFEAQARWFCSAQNSWTQWSATQIVELKACFPLIDTNPSFGVYVYDYPDLQVSIHISNFNDFNYRWYYREKGTQEWVDTIKSTDRAAFVTNLAPGTPYEFRVDVSCRENSTSFFYTVETQTSCISLDSAQVVIKEVYDSSILITVPYPGRRIYEYRYRAVGESEFTITRPKNPRITGLNPNTTYELNMRVVCEDTIPDWSPSVFFTTIACNLPLRGELSVVESHVPDSIRYRADFTNFTGLESFQFHWSYKAKSEKDWQYLEAQDKNEALFKALKTGVKYDVQLSVRCSSNAVDSFSLTTSFTALNDICAQRPDTSTIIVESPQSSRLVVKFKAPRRYEYQLRVKPADSTHYGQYWKSLQDDYAFYFIAFSGVNDFQYRYVCPSGNLSPWSDVIRVDTSPGLVESEVADFQDTGKALQQKASLKISIAPNPSSGQLSILFPTEMEPQPEAHLEVLNTAGQRIWSLKTAIDPAQTLPLDLSRQAPGLYILRIQAGQKVYTERLMISSNR